MKEKRIEIKIIFWALIALFAVFLLIPFVTLLLKSLAGSSGFTLEHYQGITARTELTKAFKNSIFAAAVSALITTVFAFLLAYTVHFTNVSKVVKKGIKYLAVLPMILPTITYGFAIIYTFGKQGLITKLFGRQLFDIYGLRGLLIGYVIYTLPVCFLLISNTMQFIDKKFLIVSRVMGDNKLRTFWTAIIRPLSGTLAASFIQAFFLSFTDFGIPASVGGTYHVAAAELYNQMLGSVPDFNKGAVVAVLMLLPSIISIVILQYLERYNIRYQKVSQIEIKKNKGRDIGCGLVSGVIVLSVLSIFAVIFIIPFVSEWPYRMSFTLNNIKTIFTDSGLAKVLFNSLRVALLTAVFGTVSVYAAALVTARSKASKWWKRIIEGIILVTNTIPGMVLGIAYILAFSGTGLQSTFTILIICNMIHFFSTPYLMMKNTLSKMNASWETTAMLMGDNWIKTILRVVTPNAFSTIVEVFSYYFINGMVTISAIIFITGARTMVLTTKIKELQHYAKFNEIFVLSILILVINLAVKFFCSKVIQIKERVKKEEKTKMRKMKKSMAFLLLGIVLTVSLGMAGCGSKKEEEVIIYSNADDEAMEAMKKALDENGYADKYILQSFGTSELGGKLIAEGKDLEADLITMSSFYIDDAQDQHDMFLELTFDHKTLVEYPNYYTPITSQEGAIIINTEEVESEGLALPVSLKDLADPAYQGKISITDITGSSSAWLMIQALISEYGESETQKILTDIYENAGPHLESSGSGPIKKVRSGEVAIGFGLRHQAVADKESGLPIDFIDPVEGNFSLTESVAVLDKGEDTNKLAMEMAECIIKNGRADLIKNYPNPVYEGETADKNQISANPKTFDTPLTVDLLKEHQELSEESKK